MKEIAIVVPISAQGVTGGAELLYEGLKQAFLDRNFNVTLIEVVVNENSFESILKGYDDFRSLDLKKFDGVISTKAPSYNIQHKNHICYLFHTMRVFYDRFDDEMESSEVNLRQREQIIKKDSLIFNNIQNLLTIGHEISNRLMQYNNVYHSDVLHPPLLQDHFICEKYENFAFIPSRLHRWKKIDFLIKSWKYVQSDINLYIAGDGEDREYFELLAKNDKRVKLLGKITNKELEHYYSSCLFVPFVPVNEDYGYVTLEAYRSKKLVLTCADSGEPTNMVIDGVSGFVIDRNEKKFAQMVDMICKDKNKAVRLGEQAYSLSKKINWENTVNEFVKRFNFEN